MLKCLTSKILLPLAIFLASGNWSHAVPADCILLAAGVYTATGVTPAIAIPRTARRGLFVTVISAISGTGSPTMTSQFQHNIVADDAYFNASSNTVSTGALTATTARQDAYVTTGSYQMLLPFHRLSLTISGTNPSFTAAYYLCYEE